MSCVSSVNLTTVLPSLVQTTIKIQNNHQNRLLARSEKVYNTVYHKLALHAEELQLLSNTALQTYVSRQFVQGTM